MNDKSKSLVKSEFMELLQRNRIALICGPVSLVLIGIIIFLLALCFDGSGRKIENTVHSFDYAYAIESNDSIDHNTYIKFDDINSLKREDQGTNILVYMQLPNVLYTEKAPMSCELNRGEIALSEKSADKLKIKTGDTVQLDFVMYDEPINYTVKYIFGYVSDFYDLEDNQDFSPVLLPFEREKSDEMKRKYVTFLSQKDRDAFMAFDESYLSEYNVSTGLKKIHKVRVIIYIVSLLFFFGGLFSYIYLFSKLLGRELERYYFDSYSIKTVRRYGVYLINLCIMIPITLVWMVMTYFTAIGIMVRLVTYVYTIVSIFIILILYIRIGRIYGKAH